LSAYKIKANVELHEKTGPKNDEFLSPDRALPRTLFAIMSKRKAREAVQDESGDESEDDAACVAMTSQARLLATTRLEILGKDGS